MRFTRVARLALGVVLLGALVACTSQQVAEKPAKHAEVTLVFQSNRLGVLEPCGCHSNPIGGIDREANALAGLKREARTVLYVDAGNLLAPEGAEKRRSHFQDKATFLTETLDGLGLDVLAPGPQDFALGSDFLRSLALKSKFAWVSSNVLTPASVPFFSPYKLVQKNGIVFGIISIADPSVKIEGFQVLGADETLKKWLPDVSRQADVIVVLSQLPIEQNEQLAEKHPEIQIVVGADAKYTADEAFWVNGKTLVLDPHINGFMMGRLDLDLNLPFQGFYSPKVVQANAARLQSLEAKLAANPSDKALAQEVETIKKRDSVAAIPNGSQYRHELIKLDPTRYGQKNAISKQVEAFKETVRKKYSE